MSRSAAGNAQLTGLTMKFATHMANLRLDDIPPDVVDKARFIVRDGLGNQVAASAISEPARRVVEMVKEWGGTPQSGLVGFGDKLPTPHAALCNAMMGHGIELDDAHGTGLIKAGSVLVPSALAVSQWCGASGADTLAGIIGAYDIAIRVAKAINPGHRQRGYHTTGTVSALGAAAMTARLLGCDAERIASAIGLAAMQSAGIQSYLDDPCMAKPFSPGKSAFNGVIAGIMASRGFTGPKKALESKEGFLNAFTDEARADDLNTPLGEHFSIMEVGFKPHAACRYAHGPIDLAQQAFREDGARLENVEKVVVGMSELAIRQASKPHPSNLNAAMGSTQFGVALALSVGQNGLREYWEGFNNSDVHEGSARVELEADERYGLGGRQARIAVHMRDGRVIEHSSEQPKGEPGNPLTPQELEAKYFTMTRIVMRDEQARHIAEMAMAMDALPCAGAILPETVIVDGPRVRAA